MIGNENTGDLTTLAEKCIAFKWEATSNWISGKIGSLHFEGKIFANSSVFGINEGRISKLNITDPRIKGMFWETCLFNYDRGWDFGPNTLESEELLNTLLECFNGKGSRWIEPERDDDE